MISPKLIEVTKQTFYDKIGPLDVELTTITNFPYTTDFTLRYSRMVKGRIVDEYTDRAKKMYPIVRKYYIESSLLTEKNQSDEKFRKVFKPL